MVTSNMAWAVLTTLKPPVGSSYLTATFALFPCLALMSYFPRLELLAIFLCGIRRVYYLFLIN